MACIKFDSALKLPSGYHGEYRKCCVMKVSKFAADPMITKILHDITADKWDGESIKEYALRMGVPPMSFKKLFDDHEIQSICENPDNFHNFDQTLKFKCIRLFMEVNYKSDEYESFRDRISTPLNKLKGIRNNNLCHNRETFTESQYHDLAQSIKDPLVGLNKLRKYNWDRSIDISYEEKKTEATINQIMKDPLNDDEFAYMRLQIVIRFVAEPVIYTVTKLVCFDKEEENYEEYILKRVIKKREYKNTFCNEEQTQLQRKSREMNRDMKLCLKIIMICKDRHYKLNKKTKGELDTVIGNTRGIRNRIYHKMLSMTANECLREAQNLGNCLRELGEFARKLGLYEGLDVNEIDIKQIDIDIKEIMSLPHSYFHKCAAHTC